MKKLVSIFLAVSLILLSGVAAVQGYAEKQELTKYPVIVVPGYSASTLMKVNEDGTKEQVWGLDFNEIGNDVVENIALVGKGIGKLTLGDAQYISEVIGNEILDVTADIACNPDGSSKENLVLKFETAEESNWQNIYDEYGIDYRFEAEHLDKYIEKYNLPLSQFYSFNSDFRMGAIECAERLDEFIGDVLEYSGAEKVNLVAISHGGQVSGAYLSLFGYKQQVHNAVLTVPALGGASLVYDMLTQEAALDELNLIRFIEYGEMIEEDYHWLVEAQELGFLDDIIQGILPYIFGAVGYWGSIWDFCPSSVYEDMKSKWLDKNASAELIAKSDAMHELMTHYSENLGKCESEYGINISIVAGTDNACTSGWRQNSDGIITTEAATGATCAAFGSRFADGYTQINPCDGKYKVSPAMTIDASTAYLPDDTFFFDGLFHGQTFKDSKAFDLIAKALFTDTVKNVYSCPEFPQFNYTDNASLAVWASFDKSQSGYLTADDNALIVRNVSADSRDLTVLAITVDGADLNFDFSDIGTVKAGESISIPFTGTLPAKSKTRVNVTISYFVKGSITPLGERTLGFTLMNGEAPAYYQSNAFASDNAATIIDRYLPDLILTLLKDLGLYRLVSMVVNIAVGLAGRIF